MLFRYKAGSGKNSSYFLLKALAPEKSIVAQPVVRLGPLRTSTVSLKTSQIPERHESQNAFLPILLTLNLIPLEPQTYLFVGYYQKSKTLL